MSHRVIIDVIVKAERTKIGPTAQNATTKSLLLTDYGISVSRAF